MACALITGASSGLGLEFAKLLAADGHSLVLVARRLEAMEIVKADLLGRFPELKIDIINMDLGLPSAGSALFAVLGTQNLEIDILINNAGFGSTGEFKDLPLKNELQMIDLNIRTLVELTHLILPGMIMRGHGRILNVGSTAGFQPGPYMSTYYASKAFVNSFSEGLHEELKGTGVTCSVLAPGATATEFAKTSGNADSRLFNMGTVADAKEVAKAGYDGMNCGKAVIVPGMINKLLAQSLRVSPRFLTRKLAGRLNRE